MFSILLNTGFYSVNIYSNLQFKCNKLKLYIFNQKILATYRNTYNLYNDNLTIKND